jgi:peroxiredoxin
MAQLRHEHERFRDAEVEVVVIVPNGPKTIERYLLAHPLPYPVLSDKGNLVAQQYGINTHQARFLALFTRTTFLIGRERRVRCAEYDVSYLTDPDNCALLAVLDGPDPISAA